jgi:hypothetical protein
MPPAADQGLRCLKVLRTNCVLPQTICSGTSRYQVNRSASKEARVQPPRKLDTYADRECIPTQCARPLQHKRHAISQLPRRNSVSSAKILMKLRAEQGCGGQEPRGTHQLPYELWYPDAFESGGYHRGPSSWIGGNQVWDTGQVHRNQCTQKEDRPDTGAH